MSNNSKFSIHFVARYFIITIVLAFFIARMATFASTKIPAIKSFIKNKGDYSALRLSFIDYADPIEAKMYLPEDARVTFSKKEWDFPLIAARYILYPRIFVEEGDYFFDVNQNKIAPPQDWTVVDLPSGASLYARPGLKFTKKNIPKYSILKTICIVVGTSVLYIITGLYLCALIGLPINKGGLLWYISTSFLLGFFLLNSVLWFALICGVPFQKIFIVGLWLAMVIGLYFLSRHRFNKLQEKIWDYIKVMFVQFKESDGKGYFYIFSFVIFFLFCSIATSHMMSWDEMSHWLMKSKVIFHQQQLNFDYTHVNFYPILWTLSVAVLFEFFGAAFHGLSTWMIAFLFVVFIGQFVGALNILKLKKMWHWLSLMLFITFFLDWNFFVSTAEPIFMCYLMAVLAALLAWINESKKDEYLTLGIWMIFGLSLVKFEGWVTVIVLGAALLISQYKKISIKQALIIVGLGLLTLVPVFGWVKWIHWMNFTDAISHFKDPITIEKLIIIFELIWRNLFPMKLMHAYLMAILILSSVFFLRSQNRGQVFLMVAFLGLTLFSCVGVVGWPVDDLENQLKVATSRLFLHATPALCLWWGCVFIKQED